jgi:hypothetical protein
MPDSPVIGHGDFLGEMGDVGEHFITVAFNHAKEPQQIEAAEKRRGVAIAMNAPILVNRESILEEAQRIVNGPRAESYGPPQKNFADIAYGWNAILLREGEQKITPEQVALCMIWLKMMRFQNGKPDRDSIVDIAGYAATIEKVLGDKLK